jgi:hypothetical protein
MNDIYGGEVMIIIYVLKLLEKFLVKEMLQVEM